MITRGIAYMLVATLAFSFMNTMAKQLSALHPMQVVFFRAFGTFIFIFPFMLYKGVSIRGKEPKWLLLRGLVGVISLGTFFMAMQRIPLGSAVSIRYLGPIFGTILAFYFLKEKVNWLQWVSFGIAFAGVALLKGFDLRIDYYSLTLILISAVFVGIVFVLIRYLSAKEHHLTIINYFMIFSIVVSLFFVNHWRMPIVGEWLPVISIGVFGLIGQVFMTKAFQREETSVLAPFKYSELAWTMMLGFFFFSETYTWIPLSGILLIVLGVLLSLYAKKQIV